jgi:hexosaminidase
MIRSVLFMGLVIFSFVIGNAKTNSFANERTIPLVQYLKFDQGYLQLGSGFDDVECDKSLQFEKEYLQKFLTRFIFKPTSKDKIGTPIKVKLILLESNKFSSEEAYEIIISPEQVEIRAKSKPGIFYGIVTFIQVYLQSDGQIRLCRIIDYPKFSWRGMHLDVSRHFYDVDFIKKYIDLLAMYKMNIFHWHLTDDQGWRIQINKYPKLTQVGSWRKGTMVGPYADQKYINKLYGGFYTQEQIKEVVVYAAQRHITVVPEIEMPGHALAALASYPEFSCVGGPFEVARGWGVFEDVFCANENTFKFLEDVLSEVIELFPSKIIHIGGDECPKIRWKTCPLCQKTRIENNLLDENELQSFFVNRIQKFLESKGRKLIGWDEILEGVLNKDALVMSWRGMEGGINAAKEKHSVVMSPGSHCYFDHYQGDARSEPLAFGGFTTLQKVYSFNPIPKELNKCQARFILGAQGNVWTEYISGTTTEESINNSANVWNQEMSPQEHVEYMVLPRLLALAEVTWGTSKPTNYDDFLSRVLKHRIHILTPLGYNFSNAIYEIALHVFANNGKLYAQFSAPLVKSIYYKLIRDRAHNESDFIFMQNDNTKPILIDADAQLNYYHDFDGIYEKSLTSSSSRKLNYTQKFSINKATAQSISLVNNPSENYSFGGAFSLVNGIHARGTDLNKDWLGFFGKDLIATISLEKQTQICSFGINFMEREASWIYLPKNVYFEVSIDGRKYTQVGKVNSSEINEVSGKVITKVKCLENIKYVRVVAENAGVIPTGKPGSGNMAWLFVDEIMID